MSRALSQVRALLRLQLRHWMRSSLNPASGAPERSARRSATLLLRVMFFAMIALNVWQIGALSARLNPTQDAAQLVGLQLLCVGVILAGGAWMTWLPVAGQRGAASPLLDPWLRSLPLRRRTRVVRVLLQQVVVLPYGPLIAVGAAGAAPRTLWGWVQLAAVGALAPIVALPAAYALSSVGALLLPSHRRRALIWPCLATLGVGLLTLMASVVAPGAALRLLGEAGLGPPLSSFGSPVVDPQAPLSLASFAAAVACAAGLLGVGAGCEYLGFDPLDSSGASPPKRAKGVLDWAGAGRLLAKREGAARMLWVIAALLLAVPAGFLASSGLSRPIPAGWVATLLNGFGGLTLYAGALLALTQGNRAVQRDIEARGLLCALPIEPRDTLAGKVAALRRLMLPLFLGQLALAVAAAWLGHWELAARLMLSGVALAIFCDTTVSVAFLSRGLAGPSLSRLSLDRFLALFPLAGVAAAPNLPSALPPLLGLVLIAAAASRAARRAVRFFDDPAEEARSSQVWRAALVFATFMAVQAMGATFIAPFADDARLTTAVSFSAAAASLLVMTFAQRHEGLRFAYAPKPRWSPIAGLALGGASGLLALGYQRVLESSRWQPVRVDFAELADTGVDLWAKGGLFVAVVVMAPVAEETFFRGWLQGAVETELPERWRRHGFALTALAFASAHPAPSFPPVLVLGLVAGALQRRGVGLSACIAAHFGHNACVLWFAG